VALMDGEVLFDRSSHFEYGAWGSVEMFLDPGTDVDAVLGVLLFRSIDSSRSSMGCGSEHMILLVDFGPKALKFGQNCLVSLAASAGAGAAAVGGKYGRSR